MDALKQGADALFILLGGIMVLAMHAGFAFLELGTVRKKNQVNALVKILTDFGMSTSPSSATASNMKLPRDAYFDGTRFYVADFGQNRVMVWNGFPSSNNQGADLVIGQPNLTSKDAATTQSGLYGPFSVAVAGDALFVADFTNDRVMVWTPIPSQSGAQASYVLGVDNFTTAGGSPAATQASLDGPMSVSVVGNKLFVADYTHNRVMRFGLNLQ